MWASKKILKEHFFCYLYLGIPPLQDQRKYGSNEIYPLEIGEDRNGKTPWDFLSVNNNEMGTITKRSRRNAYQAHKLGWSELSMEKFVSTEDRLNRHCSNEMSDILQ